MSSTPTKSEPPSTDEDKRLKALEKMKAVTGDNIYNFAKIEEYDWYFGMLAIEDIADYMEKVGDFAVRTSNARKFTELYLSVRGKESILEFVLVCGKKSNEWTLKVKKTERKNFKSIPDLINFYKTNPLPLLPQFGKITLRLPCKRPKWIINRSAIKYGKLLGCGNFCQVFEGTYNGRPAAIKSCNPVQDKMKSEEQLDQELVARENLIKEGKLMQDIKHANIVKFFGLCFDKPPVLIAMELCVGGALIQHLTNMGNRISNGERLKYCIQVARGMDHLHKRGLIHRDLAARNCLISMHGVVKIADFGLSKLTSEVAAELTTFKMQIPLRWMAPETLTRDQKFSEKSDMWSYGVLLYEVFSNGAKPWPMEENKKIATYIRHGRMPSSFLNPDAPPEIVSLTKEKIWLVDPEKRLRFSQLLETLVSFKSKYPVPELSKLTVNLISGVKALHKAQIELIEKIEEKKEDIAKVAMSDAMKRAEAQNQVSRDVTVDEPVVQEIALSTKTLPERQKSKSVPSLN